MTASIENPTVSYTEPGDQFARDYQRLSAQSLVWAQATDRALDQVSPGYAAQALDVGCGGGDVMRAIAKRVGQFGTVTGIDIEARLDAVLAPLCRSNPDVFRFLVGDIRQLSRVAGGPFDLVFARLLLMRLEQPETILRKLWEWVRPGGALLVMDYDLTGMRSTPQHPVIERGLRLVCAAYRRAGRDIEIGARMPELFIAAGIDEPDGCEVSSVILSGGQSMRMLLEIIASLRPVILESQLADEAALNRLERELAEAVHTRTFIRWPDMVATWKRKGECS